MTTRRYRPEVVPLPDEPANAVWAAVVPAAGLPARYAVMTVEEAALPAREYHA
jgi:hypothetical protein